jgi:hypothetical protein
MANINSQGLDSARGSAASKTTKTDTGKDNPKQEKVKNKDRDYYNSADNDEKDSSKDSRENSGVKIPGGVSWEENPPEYKMPEDPWGSVTRDENLDEKMSPEKSWGGTTRDEDLSENRPPTEDSRRPAMGATGGSGSSVGTGQASPAGTLHPKGEKAVQDKLKRLQKNAPELAKSVATGNPVGIAALGAKLMSQFDASKDWLFILLINFAILKDLIDIILELAIPPVGIVVKFITAFLMLMLTIVVMIISGSSLSNRGAAKYIISLAIGTAADALPFPIPAATIEVLLIYGFTLFDRLMDSMEEEKAGDESNPAQLPAFAAADNYNEGENLAA